MRSLRIPACRLSVWFAVCLLLSVWTGCERVEVPAVGSGATVPSETDEVETPDITGLGGGTMDCPYTVTDIVEGRVPVDRQCWVVGHVVGYTQRTIGAAEFTVEGAVRSNVLLAAEPDEEEAAYCVPVELNKSRLHTGISLMHNPDKLGYSLLVLATVRPYFSVAGLRDVQQYCWLGDVHYAGDEEMLPAPGEDEYPDTTDPDDIGNGDSRPEVPADKPGTLPEDEPLFLPDDPAGYPLVPVTKSTDIRVGALYTMGLSRDNTVWLIQRDASLTSVSKWRSAIAVETEAGQLLADNRTALFQLQTSGEFYRLYEWMSGTYLGYHTTNKNTSSAPVYTLAEGDCRDKYATEVRIASADGYLSVLTAARLPYGEKTYAYYLSIYNDASIRWCMSGYQTPLRLYRLTAP